MSEEAAITDGADTPLYLYDTPGLEDAGGVFDWLETHTDARADGIERLQSSSTATARITISTRSQCCGSFCKVTWRCTSSTRANPSSTNIGDELTILSWCAKPVMPVFNFTGGQLPEAWTTMLARRNLHVFAGFDTIAFDFEGN